MSKLWVLFALGCGAAPTSGPRNTRRVAAFEVTWIVHPLVPDPKEPDTLLYPLTLVAGGDRIELEPQLGGLKPYNQSVCSGKAQVDQYPLADGEVAKITFFEGGAGGYLVKRSRKGLVLIAWNQSDGLCEDPKTHEPAPCPRSERQVREFVVGPAVEVTQQLFVVDKSGKQSPIDCTSADEPVQ